ncbi:unannotated protein [freshwater metagenome]|uniref:Unannotated protein n=1 Tax=freshwater metagenome TaxID=449393 RepID=A0A6J7DPY9_9ZZZZ
MDVGRRGQPRQEGRVFYRVPTPEATPAQDLVAPPGTQHDADAQDAPGQHGPLTEPDGPTFIDPTGYQHGHREDEGHRKAHEAGVEQWRVSRHEWIVLQQGVRSGALRRMNEIWHEGIGRSGHETHEEGRHGKEHQCGPLHHAIGYVVTITNNHHHQQRRQQQCPQQDGAFEGTPHSRHRINRGRERGVVFGHIGEIEVVRQQGYLHNYDCRERAGQPHDGNGQ